MKKTLFLIALFTAQFLFAQNIEFEKKNFKNDPKGFKKAMDSIKEGDKYYIRSIEWQVSAIPYYLSANKFNPNSATLNYKIGACYVSRFSPFKTMAIPYLENALKLNPNVAPNIHYLLGRAYHINMEWDKAILNYNTYVQGLDQKKNAVQIADAKKKIDECHSGMELAKHAVTVFIDNMGPSINTQYPEYGPIVSSDETSMIFTSRRPSAKEKHADEGMYYENLYVSLFRNGKWLPATNMGEPINKPSEHEATAGLSPDGKILYIYKNENNGDIYQSLLEGGEWSKPQKMGGKINTKYRETS
ncbi:MAG TPA: hypothetical protein VN922_06005, partial [Bacteroidia bacterium]|nr:hypothetical protein [Bacteroidia bacterium]